MKPQQAEAPKIQIRIKLYGTLRRHRPAEAEGSQRQPFEMQLTPGATIADMLTILGIGEGYVAAAAINGQAADLESQLHQGDEIRLFPPSAGG